MPKKSLQQIQAQIAKLQAEAEAIKKREAAGVIARIKEAIVHYGLTAQDLGLAAPVKRATKESGGKTKAAAPGAKAVKSPKASKAKKVPKTTKTRKPRPGYSDGTHTWSGMGPKPKWFKDALAQGKTPADLIVKAG